MRVGDFDARMSAVPFAPNKPLDHTGEGGQSRQLWVLERMPVSMKYSLKPRVSSLAHTQPRCFAYRAWGLHPLV